MILTEYSFQKNTEINKWQKSLRSENCIHLFRRPSRVPFQSGEDSSPIHLLVIYRVNVEKRVSVPRSDPAAVSGCWRAETQRLFHLGFTNYLLDGFQCSSSATYRTLGLGAELSRGRDYWQGAAEEAEPGAVHLWAVKREAGRMNYWEY